MLLVAPRVFRAPEGPAAREARRPHFVRRVGSLSGQAPPPPSTPVEPGVLMGLARRLEAQPGHNVFIPGDQ